LTIDDALAILRFLSGLPTEIGLCVCAITCTDLRLCPGICQDALGAALIVSIGDIPTRDDVMAILYWLNGMQVDVLDEVWGWNV
jgi:hypothetical protein